MKPIIQILENNNSTLQKLIAQSEHTKQYNRLLQLALEPNLAKHCQFAQLEKNTLTVTVDSPAWATRFRYAIPELKKNISAQPEFNMVKKIRYIISQQEEVHEKKTKKPAMSQVNADLWQDMLNNLKNKKIKQTKA